MLRRRGRAGLGAAADVAAPAAGAAGCEHISFVMIIASCSLCVRRGQTGLGAAAGVAARPAAGAQHRVGGARRRPRHRRPGAPNLKPNWIHCRILCRTRSIRTACVWLHLAIATAGQVRRLQLLSSRKLAFEKHMRGCAPVAPCEVSAGMAGRPVATKSNARIRTERFGAALPCR